MAFLGGTLAPATGAENSFQLNTVFAWFALLANLTGFELLAIISQVCRKEVVLSILAS
jgi:hypothetical protein